ncbi:DNA uptake protein ComE-like DNA-binding protein [Chryseobacterium ginsenosidimutans]|uniref:helix-hairpin-helix domain-containing protein n=1 Tax=Chryseobacterium ginsenosidimutans TaxID=687846 RepID=UPI00216A2139|nr:helix-hairpin-helix domain-containing protein [Chryseobacterium ginsenosidimutans]MCS3868908.1 DNA uptake protein ComE-like DNA-binding protein [Chryseobacterium ginsenosidimutans]
MKKNYYQKLAFMGMMLIILFTFQKYTSKEKEDFSDVKFISAHSVPLHLTEFDPNDLDKKQWENLGFTEKQTATILNYKKVVGGKFSSKEQFKKCFAVSEEKFSVLESYILLPETNKEAKSVGFKNYEKKSITISGKFNPDHYSVNDWIKMGFSERQAGAILKYKSYLGGSFVSKEKFKECFIINDENFQKINPYLILPEKTPPNFNSYAKNFKSEKTKVQYHAFDPNTLDLEGWKSFGFSEKQAQTIVNFRDRNLKGSFKSLEDIQRCFVISAEKFEEMRPFIKMNSSAIAQNNDAQKVEIKQQQETDFSKVDLNSVTFKQLIEFGFDEKAAGSMIGFRKKLGGFVNKEQILTTYNIDVELVKKLLATAQLNTSNVPKYTLVDAPEEWLKNHPYFKYSADKIIFYRISEKEERKIWKLLKVKPEYETRMRLYLK